jgi:hypothetical protein
MAEVSNVTTQQTSSLTPDEIKDIMCPPAPKDWKRSEELDFFKGEQTIVSCLTVEQPPLSNTIITCLPTPGDWKRSEEESTFFGTQPTFMHVAISCSTVGQTPLSNKNKIPYIKLNLEDFKSEIVYDTDINSLNELLCSMVRDAMDRKYVTLAIWLARDILKELYKNWGLSSYWVFRTLYDYGDPNVLKKFIDSIKQDKSNQADLTDIPSVSIDDERVRKFGEYKRPDLNIKCEYYDGNESGTYYTDLYHGIIAADSILFNLYTHSNEHRVIKFDLCCKNAEPETKITINLTFNNAKKYVRLQISQGRILVFVMDFSKVTNK